MNLINGQFELWVEIATTSRYPRQITMVSNCGRYMRASKEFGFSTYSQKPNKRLYQIIAENFIPKTEEDIALGRNQIDHITHRPDGMNINDVRNLRWCTNQENQRFPEARKNISVGGIKTYFGKKYYEHYGYSARTNRKQYNKAHKYYTRHGKFLWEIETNEK